MSTPENTLKGAQLARKALQEATRRARLAEITARAERRARRLAEAKKRAEILSELSTLTAEGGSNGTAQ
jgi:hypothetical protein